MHIAKDYVDMINMNKIIESNRDRFKRLVKAKKLTNEELIKRILTMYLPDHEISLWCIWVVTKDCLFITFNDKLCLLFRANWKYWVYVEERVQLFQYKDICLYKLPKFMKGQIIFKCFFPLCEA